MKVADLLEKRRSNWHQLEVLCETLKNHRKKKIGAERISEFARLYRAACADLALADAYNLPPSTVQYLHRLVGRAHSELHRSQFFKIHLWFQLLFVETPQRIFNDRCVHVAFVLFWSLFLTSAYLAYNESVWPGYAESVLGEDQLEMMVASFEEFGDRPFEVDFQMACYYISHNTGIGLTCFATSLLIIPGLMTMAFNAVHLGAAFGYMFRPDIGDASDNFQNFVTAHGPFELTAIVLGCGTGLRLGVSWLITNGLTRSASIRKAGRESMPMVGAMIMLFFLAALIEGFISPTSLPWIVKATIAVISSGLLLFYFVFLGIPRETWNATR